jgi:hypothetical protein
MDDKIKYALLAVGAYFLYDWYSKNQAAAAVVIPATPTVVPATTTPVVPVTVAPIAATPIPSANTVLLAAMTNDQVATFAAQGNADAVAEANRRGMRYDHHTWNWYRAQALGQQPDPELWAPGATTSVVTVSEYLALRAVAGMSGMSGLGWAPILPFSTAWSA